MATQPEVKEDVAQDGFNATQSLADMLGQDALEGVADAIGSSDTPPGDSVETPTSEPDPVTETSDSEPTPDVDTAALLQEVTRLRESEQRGAQEKQQLEQRQVVEQQWQAAEREAQEMGQALQSQGYDQATYGPIIQKFRQAKYVELQTTHAAYQMADQMNRKGLLATELSIKHGIPIAELWAYNDADSMTRAAEQGKEAHGLKKELADLRKQVSDIKVPRQSFENGRGSGGGLEDKRFLDQFNDPNFDATKADWERLDAIQQRLP